MTMGRMMVVQTTAASRMAQELIAPVRDDPYKNSQSIEFQFRAKRFQIVRDMIDTVLAERGRADIIDLGGTETYWAIGRDFLQRNRHRLSITLVNPEIQPVEDDQLFTAIAASATDDRRFDGQHFDMVHSNSVIEHVGDWPEMDAFAANVRRLAPRYYVQTPNFWFPYEPHFRVAGFQYLPERLRISLIQRYSLGFFPKIASPEEAADIIHHHRLLTASEMGRLFPDADIRFEKLKFLNKSILAVKL